jgi:hypothetical protein
MRQRGIALWAMCQLLVFSLLHLSFRKITLEQSIDDRYKDSILRGLPAHLRTVLVSISSRLRRPCRHCT